VSSRHVSAVVARRAPGVRSRAFSLETALLALGIAVVAVSTAWSGDALQVAGGDYSTSYEPAMKALLDGHLGAFFANLPTNGAGGSVLLRAPFAGLGKLFGGDQLLIFRLGALACLLALGALGLWLAGDLRRRGVALATRIGLVALCAATPALLEAVSLGHPEEALGAVLCIAAVLAAGAGRPLLAGALLGAAVINKPWGALAVGPVLLCAPAGERKRVLAPAGAIVGCWLASAALVAPSQLLRSLHGAETSIVAHPQDLWWPLHHMDGLYPVPPALLYAHARQLAVALGLGAAIALALRALRSHTPAGTQRCLALLAFGFALRCLLEPSSHGYYQLPLLVALATWEVRARRSVAIALAATLLLTLDFGRLNESATATFSYLLYLAVVLPICVVLLADICRPLAPEARADAWRAAAAMRRRPPGWPRRFRSPSGAG
jgi:hypothetical protein